LEYTNKKNLGLTNKMPQTFVNKKKWDLKLPNNDQNYSIAFNSGMMFKQSSEQPSGSGGIWGQQLSEVGIFFTIIHEFQHANGIHHSDMASNSDYRSDMKNSLKEYFGNDRFSSELLEAVSWYGLQETPEFKTKYGDINSQAYRDWFATVDAILFDGCSSQNSNEDKIDNRNEKLKPAATSENCDE
jgi:hypothetical protein